MVKVTKIHLEASTYCNARCPGCPRNIYGFNASGRFIEQNISPHKFKIIRNQLPDVKRVSINGGLGDPMMNPSIVELVDICECEVSITTNGSIGKLKSYFELASRGVTIYFSIDGLHDTNHLYRQDVDWNKLMERARHFIRSGGSAIWKWVPFKHNNHQTNIAKEIAKEMGFEDFEISHQRRDDFPVLDRYGKLSHWIQPHDRPGQPKKNFDPELAISLMSKEARYLQDPGIFEIEQCDHLDGEVYVTAAGEITPCCYHGTAVANREIVPVKDFEKLKNSWGTRNCDPTCAAVCGKLKT